MRFPNVLPYVCGAFVSGCGAPASHPHPAPTPQPIGAPAKPAPPEAVGSPVPAPPELSAVVSVKDARALQRAARDLLGGAAPILSRFTVDSAAEALLGTALADVVDLGKPIDLGFLEASDLYAASFALASIDDAKRNLAEDFDLAPREGGGVALTPHQNGDTTKLRCEIRPAPGDSPYRLVCASRASALRAVAPYLVQTVAREAVPDDARLRLFHPSFSVWQGTSPAPETPEQAPLFQAVREGFHDLSALTFAATLAPDGVHAEMKEVFQGTQSPFTRIALAHARDAGPLPDLFWRLPADALVAGYARGADAADLEPLRKSLLRATETSIREQTTSEEMVERARKVIASTLLTGGPIAAAYGFDVPGAVSAIASATVKRPLERSALHGWFLVGLEEPSSRWADAFHEAIALQTLPVKAPQGMLHRRAEATLTRCEELALTDATLPPHTAHFALREYTTAKGKARGAAKWTFHVYVVPDGPRTWLAMGENDTVVVAKARGTIAAGPDDGLASRTDLRSLRGATGFGGFVTLGLFPALNGPSDPADPVAARTLLERLSALPEAGATPITFFTSGGGGERDGVELRVVAPNGAVKGILSQWSGRR